MFCVLTAPMRRHPEGLPRVRQVRRTMVSRATCLSTPICYRFRPLPTAFETAQLMVCLLCLLWLVWWVWLGWWPSRAWWAVGLLDLLGLLDVAGLVDSGDVLRAAMVGIVWPSDYRWWASCSDGSSPPKCCRDGWHRLNATRLARAATPICIYPPHITRGHPDAHFLFSLGENGT